MTVNSTTAFYQDHQSSSRFLAPVLTLFILFVLSALGNVTVFIALLTSPLRKSRFSKILLHLTISDLIVTFVIIPGEISWRFTQFWLAGNVACKIFACVRAFGFYLSSMVLVVISIDRYLAIVHPLKTKILCNYMLVVAWGLAFLCSLPQVLFQYLCHTRGLFIYIYLSQKLWDFIIEKPGRPLQASIQ